MEKDKSKEKLKQLSEEISSLEEEQNKLRSKTNELENHFYEKNRLYNELEETWKNGEMKYLTYNIQMELKHQERIVFNALEDEKEHLKSKIRSLENKKEQELENKEKNNKDTTKGEQ